MKILIIISQNISVLASDDPNLSTFYRNEGKNKIGVQQIGLKVK